MPFCTCPSTSSADEIGNAYSRHDGAGSAPEIMNPPRGHSVLGVEFSLAVFHSTERLHVTKHKLTCWIHFALFPDNLQRHVGRRKLSTVALLAGLDRDITKHHS